MIVKKDKIKFINNNQRLEVIGVVFDDLWYDNILNIFTNRNKVYRINNKNLISINDIKVKF